jgi:hypothetical protein
MGGRRADRVGPGVGRGQEIEGHIVRHLKGHHGGDEQRIVEWKELEWAGHDE